jgi:ethanolamine ammonia-lyase large subunit
MDNLFVLLTAAGVTYVMGVPGADDVMLNYQSTSYHDVLAMRRLFQRQPAPEFAAWLEANGIGDAALASESALPPPIAALLESW